MTYTRKLDCIELKSCALVQISDIASSVQCRKKQLRILTNGIG